ncbi:transcriptional regulator ERG homolog isoform X1 [Pocillopora verrucosa]|uniref:transcriptional regulator ERG homolog isoform X1 n=1 Tax=Pocillopora verrucosa TaxID=203993 RepID=UPI00279748BD|nr:transcriptional regulator ERG homolog isoform X1 [Pocillopora verrucosa]XP_058954110.1 transcriptional regulator ERG homolog isoform X1 [Pocillopora verrucosa]XP_058954112.1 transcriptional regulator ERG homolog isoform X1 [Pocillopora verrucosa]XP_058954113.1 transcriptional regulator ERG homolog isoform X1 [Pocillopora verrucosa]XP_058954114.1 transcriptional regulator ERG homolog isoform X1 [Pocillopora verrucosa]XP_058954115.1 transcriptional regulator ERG homolog isoform X1 [Pocillopor
MDSESGEPRYKNIVHLWEFLYELLASGDKCSSIIAWIREEHGEFKLKNKEEVAKRWGAYKKIKGMNYEKLSRALRHYYPKGIIKKVAGQRLVYKFNKLPYKYEPGVTRSLYHGSRIKACIQEPTKSKEADPTPPKTNTNTSLSAFTPVRGHPRKSWSWPLLSTPTNPFVLYPGSTPNTPTIFDSSKTMIVFPFGPSPPVHHPLQLHLKREHDKPVGKMITSEVTSIPVSVIQRV